MAEDLTSPNPTVTPAANPPVVTPPAAPAPVTNGTANPGVSEPQPTQGTNVPGSQAPTTTEPAAPPVKDESFTQVDVSKLSPENQEAYNNMLRDYKRKTQEVADQRRSIQGEVDQYKDKAGQYDSIASDPAFVNYWNQQANPQPTQPQGPPPPQQTEITDEEYNLAFTSKEGFAALQKKLSSNANTELKNELRETQERLGKAESNQTVSRANEYVAAFKKRPEYQGFEKYDAPDKRLITYQVAALKHTLPKNPTERDWENLLKTTYKRADSVYKSIFEEGLQAGLKRQTERIDNVTEPPAGGTAPTFSGVDPKKVTPAEAVDMAKRGIRVPQDW